jgi:hypothetical protein
MRWAYISVSTRLQEAQVHVIALGIAAVEGDLKFGGGYVQRCPCVGTVLVYARMRFKSVSWRELRGLCSWRPFSWSILRVGQHTVK